MAYATVQDFEAGVEGWETTNAPALQRLLERASRDIDAYLGGPLPAGDTLRFEPLLLPANQAGALRRACIAQAHWRFLGGEELFIRSQHSFAAGPDFQVRGELARVSPGAEAALAGSGLPRAAHTAPPALPT